MSLWVRLWCAAITDHFHSGMLLLPRHNTHTHTHITTVFTSCAWCCDSLKPLAGKKGEVTTLTMKAGEETRIIFCLISCFRSNTDGICKKLFEMRLSLKKTKYQSTYIERFFIVTADYLKKDGLNFQKVKNTKRHEWRRNKCEKGDRECGGGLLMTIKRQREIISPVKNTNTHAHTEICTLIIHTPTCACHDHKGCWVIMLMMP